MGNFQGHVLIVDDHRANGELLARFLQSEGHQTEMAVDGLEALRMLREDDYDLVLLDVMMPTMDGYAVLEDMRKDARLAHIPVIMVSAVDEMDSVVKCIELGAEDYLFKPVKGVLLRARVNASLEKKFAQDRQRTKTEELVQLNQLAKSLTATFKTRRILQTTLEFAVRDGQSTGGFIAQLSADGLTEILVMDVTGTLVGEAGKEVLTPEEIDTARKMTTAQVIKQPRVTAPAGVVDEGEEWLILPIRHDEQVLAIMALHLAAAPGKQALKIDYLGRLCDHAAAALWNARLYHLAVAGSDSQRTQIASITRDLKLATAMIKQYISVLAAENREINGSAKFTTLEAIRTKANQMFTLTNDLDVELLSQAQSSMAAEPPARTPESSPSSGAATPPTAPGDDMPNDATGG